jgi:hypothetical protein
VADHLREFQYIYPCENLKSCFVSCDFLLNLIAWIKNKIRLWNINSWSGWFAHIILWHSVDSLLFFTCGPDGFIWIWVWPVTGKIFKLKKMVKYLSIIYSNWTYFIDITRYVSISLLINSFGQGTSTLVEVLNVSRTHIEVNLEWAPPNFLMSNCRQVGGNNKHVY